MDNFQCITVSTIKFDQIKHLQIGKSNPKVSYILNQLVNSSLSKNSICIFLQNQLLIVLSKNLKIETVILINCVKSNKTSRPAEPGCESVTGERVEARATVRAIRVVINKSYFNRTLYFDDYLIISSHYPKKRWLETKKLSI